MHTVKVKENIIFHIFRNTLRCCKFLHAKLLVHFHSMFSILQNLVYVVTIACANLAELYIFSVILSK